MAFIGNTPISVAFLTDTFSGDGSTTAFTMTVAPANTSSIIVAITGVLQDPSTYSVSGTTLTFSAAPPTGTSNISVRYLGIPASGVTTTAYRTVTDFTATAGQTSFSVPSYTIGYIDVYRNGVRLVSTDYTATTGTTVVLTNACTVGDAVVTESFYVSSVLNAIQQYNGSSTNQTLTTPTLVSPIITGSTPQVTVYTSGSGTYTTPTGARYLTVKMVGGGGGGSGGGSGSPANGGGGGTSTFGTSLLSCTGGGSTGQVASIQAGGVGTVTAPAIGYGITGATSASNAQNAVSAGAGGAGGPSPFGGNGFGGWSLNAGQSAVSNSGSGGGGGGNSTVSGYVGAGGTAGGYVDAIIPSPSATYSYAIGAGGTAGTAGTSGGAGGTGGSGYIVVTAFF